MKLSGLVLLTILSASAFTATADEVIFAKNDFIIYSTKDKKIVKPIEIINQMDSINVLFFGEEHNDSIGHMMQNLILQLLYKKFDSRVVLSMEMFDRDVQYIMDEYLQGIIKRSYFLKDSKVWSNYSDYEPMVEFAKQNGLSVICANAPFRYVNVASTQGIDGLMKLSPDAKKSLAPLPYNLAAGAYADKLNALMGHDPNDPNSKPSYNMIPGQSLWDATMAYSIYERLQVKKDAKILHLVGRFHVEEGFGIVQRMAEFDANIKSIILTLVGDAENYPNVKFEDYKNLGEYIIFTNPEVLKSY